MKKALFSLCLGVCLCGSLLPCSADSETQTVSLPVPEKASGKPVMQALAERHTTRVFAGDKVISDQMLSDLLWAAWGINRPDGKRTVPTGRNMQEMELYVFKADGVWRYEAADNTLLRVADKDLRVGQMVGAPVCFVYAGSDSKFTDMHAGSMYQSASLCAASNGLGDVVLYSPVEKLRGTFPIKDGYRIVVAQAFGWPGTK
ncbi:nitroreductase family protein [bacterium]|nr:nitroreductase family protein [bacterium]